MNITIIKTYIAIRIQFIYRVTKEGVLLLFLAGQK